MLSCICKLCLKTKMHCFSQRMFSASALIPLQLPSRMETHLWYVLPNEVKNQSLLSQYADLLSPLEKDHVFSIHENHLQKPALLARALVRTTIARYQIRSQVSPRSLEFRKNAHGKPEVIWEQDDDLDAPPLHFNLSHTSSLIACGVTVDSPIGIDVEDKQRTMKNNILSFAKRYFTNEEVGVLRAISDPEAQRRDFIKLWTLKEAYVKALGRGFSVLLKELSYSYFVFWKNNHHYIKSTNNKTLKKKSSFRKSCYSCSIHIIIMISFTCLQDLYFFG